MARLDRAAARAGVRVVFRPGAEPELAPEAQGVDGAIGQLLAIVAGAVEQGRWQRLKACPRDVCHWAFFDHSKNHSGRWCRMEVCGNIEKARAFRERNGAAAAGLVRSRRYSIVWTLNRLVPPEVPAGRPAVIPILSPSPASPASRAASAHASIRSSVCSGSSFSCGCTPQSSWQRRTTSRRGDSASTGARGR